MPIITVKLIGASYAGIMTVSNVLSIATGGLMQHARTFAKSADRVVQQPAQTVESRTSLAEEVVHMKQAEVGYTASATMIRTIDEMTDTLLDIRA